MNCKPTGAAILAAGLLLALAAPATAAGDPAKGKLAFNQCKTCHWLTDKPKPKMGPNLNGLFGRTVGTSASYKLYSKALKEGKFKWDVAKLETYITNPKAMLPGNRMAFVGIKDAARRADLIAYLKVATVDPKAD